jgi:CRISPR-associated endonuclease/helicase Cas3
VASGVSAKTGSFEADPARRISVGREWHDADKLAAALETALVLGGCAAVIRNTVGEAQQTFAVLRGALRPRGFDVRLFHARFLFDDRQRIEREALDCFGKGPGGLPANPKRPQKAVLVATQVIEQSLDLDFDLMVSDVAPIDLVLQRVGRLHRHDRPERPIKTPVLWLLKPNQFDEVPSFGRGNEMIYDRYILLRSFLELRTRPVLNLPGGIDEMVRAVYEGEAAGSLSPEWLKALAQSRDKLEADQLEDAQKAATAILGSPWFQDDILEDGNRDLIEDEDDPTAHALIRAATRLAEPSVRAVFAHRTAGGLSLLPDGSVPLSRSRKPSLAEARRILGRAVTLQHRGVVAQLSHRAPPSGFQASGLLRHHCLLEIDESGWVRAGPYRLVPDAELGIQIIKDDMEGGPDL